MVTGCNTACLQKAWPAFAICVLALALRLAYVAFADDGRFREEHVYTGDGQGYKAIAVSLANGQGYRMNGRTTAWRAPALPLWISLSMRTVQRPLLAVRLGNCVLGSLLVLQVFFLGWMLHSYRAGLLACGLCAVSYELLNLNAYVITESLYVFLFMNVVLLLAGYSLRPSARMAAGAGALLGGVVLTRPVLQAFPLILLPWFGWMVPGVMSQQRRILHWLLFVGAFLAILSPWLIRQYRVFGAPLPLTTETGKLVFASYSPGATGGTGGWYREGVDWRAPSDLHGSDEAETSRRMTAAGLRYALTHPVRALALVPRKVWNMWRPWISGASPLSICLASLLYVPAAAGTLTGIFLLRHRWRMLAVLFLVLAYTVFLHAALHGAVRHRYPMLPVLILLASMVCVEAISRRALNRTTV